MSVRCGVSPSGAPVARVHAEFLDEKPSSCVAFVFALSLHPRQTSQENRNLWNFHPARGLQECANQGRRGGGRSFFSPCRFASAVRCDLPRTIAFTLYEEPSWSAYLSQLVVVSNRVWVPDVAGKGSAGGLAVALREAFRAYQGLWFGWSGKVASQPASQPRMVDKGRVQYALMDLTSLDRQEYYNGFANRALWPTMHYRIGLSEFSSSTMPATCELTAHLQARLPNLSVRATSCGCTTII